MAHVIVKDPEVRIDIMVKKKHWPQVVSMIDRQHCSYFKEDELKPINGTHYVVLRDIKADHGHNLAELIRMLYLVGIDPLNEASEAEVAKDKFYILIKPRKKGKKHDKKARKETGAGSKGGNGGESGVAEPKPDSEPAGVGAEPDIPGTDDLCKLQVLGKPEEAPADAGDH